MTGIKLVLVFTLFVTALIDLRKNKIPNLLVILILVLQIIVEVKNYSPINIGIIVAEMLPRMMTALILLFCLYVFFLIGAIGAGDLKLLTITALGFNRPDIFTLVTFAIAFVMSLIQMIRNKNLLDRIRYLKNYLNILSEKKALMPYFSEAETTKEKKKYSIHFSVPVLIAYCVMHLYLCMG